MLWFPAAVLVSCGGGPDELAQQPSPFGPTGIPPALRGDGGQGTRIGPGGNLPAALQDSAGVVLDANEIVFTDPDAEDPEAAMAELKELLSEIPEEGPWKRSHTNALREARRVEKPVLMWFTDSQNSPPSRALAQELFNKQEFEDWAGETFVRLQVDRQVTGENTESKADYVEYLKKHYKVRGQPTLLVLTPDGKVIGRYNGYKRGEAEYKWGQLRQGARLALEAHEEWRAKMEKKGYRMWSDPRGRTLFAKLAAYRDGELILVEPDGRRARTKESNLSPDDQQWIAEQKRARGIE